MIAAIVVSLLVFSVSTEKALISEERNGSSEENENYLTVDKFRRGKFDCKRLKTDFLKRFS